MSVYLTAKEGEHIAFIVGDKWDMLPILIAARKGLCEEARANKRSDYSHNSKIEQARMVDKMIADLNAKLSSDTDYTRQECEDVLDGWGPVPVIQTIVVDMLDDLHREEPIPVLATINTTNGEWSKEDILNKAG